MKKIIKATSSELEDAMKLAETSSDPEVLARLAEDGDTRVRMRVAANLSTPPEVLARFVEDGDAWIVRWNVADNSSTPPEVLARLAEDEADDWAIRTTIADNPSTPPEVIAKLEKASKKASKKQSSWPSPDEFAEMDDETLYDWVSDVEDEVEKELQVFLEPSVRGRMGGMFLFDESGNNNEPIEVDFSIWTEVEYEIAISVKSEKGYKSKFKNYIKSLIKDAGWVR